MNGLSPNKLRSLINIRDIRRVETSHQKVRELAISSREERMEIVMETLNGHLCVDIAQLSLQQVMS